MRSLIPFICALLILSCNSQQDILSQREFAKVYLDSLSKKFPDIKFELNPDLTISSKKGDLEYRSYTDNAYVAYKTEPDSMKNIISRYVASASELYAENDAITINNIVPVIKPVEYLDEVTLPNREGKEIPMLTEKYNDQLVIAYAADSKNNIKFLTEADLKTLSIPKDSLKSIAIKNLNKILPNFQIQDYHGLYMITAGGNYEASFILINSIWTKDNFPVDGDLIIAIPTRDLLIITGSNNKNGINKIREIVAQSFKPGNYQISEHLYKWTGRRFEKYD